MRKLWNRPNQAVWSVSTIDKDGKGNMNIATYVSAISLQPKQMMIAVYDNTKTLENIKTTKKCLLQLMTEDLAPVVRICGQMSGTKIDKISRLQKRFSLSTYKEHYYFTDCAGFLELKLIKLVETGGDHLLGVFKVETHKNLNEKNLLTSDYLKAKNYIR